MNHRYNYKTSGGAMKYKTIKNEARVEQTIKKSKFIGIARHIEDDAEAEATHENILKEFKKATHVVYAYRLGPLNEKFYFTDNGEPSGSAGKPVYSAITGEEIFNCIVLVVRYFGGIKLGVGGLIRAYHSTAKAAIQQAGIIEVPTMKNLSLEFPYEETRLVMYYIHEFNAKILKNDYGKTVNMALQIEEDKAKEFMNVILKKSRLVHFL
jgi:uncharacterized YigZ family protein